MTLVEELAITSLDYTKTLLAYEREEYTKTFQKFNSLFQDRRTKQAKFSTEE